MSELRMDKLVASAVLVSRSDAREMIRGGRIGVDGKICLDPAAKVSEKSVLTMDGKHVCYKKYRYIMLNKPAGFISSTEDAKEHTVLELLPREYRALGMFSAGRLDKDAEGLLLLTDDGDYCHNVISPKKSVKKRYYARTLGRLLPEHILAFQRGVLLRDGLQCLPAELEILSSGTESECIVTLEEGKFHQVKRMLAYCECPVQYLKRLSIGALQLDDRLAPGEWKELASEEAQRVFFSFSNSK